MKRPAWRRLMWFCLGCIGILVFTHCTTENDSRTGRIEVFVSIPPVGGLVERIGGEHVRVHMLAEKGQDPHTFDPTPRQIAALSKADVYFTVDLPFENRLAPRIEKMNPRLRIADASKGIQRRTDTAHHHGGATCASCASCGQEHAEHRHADEEGMEHDHPETDPHVWLSPDNAKHMARNISETLGKIRPEQKDFFARNTAALEADCDAVSEKIRATLEPRRIHRFYVFHPAFGYFADEFHLEQIPLEIEGKSPAPKQIQEYIRRARADQTTVIFVQPQFDAKAAETIARAIGGAVIPMDPLEKDMIKNFENMAQKLEKALIP